MTTIITKLPEGREGAAFVTVYKPIIGWKPVHMWWNPEGFWEPYDTYKAAWLRREQAEEAGRQWASKLNLPFFQEKRCKACNEADMSHCSDPENCGGPWDKRNGP